MSQEVLPQREKRLREKNIKCPNENSLGSASRRASTERRKTNINLFVCFCGLTFPQGRLHREKKTKRNKENVLYQNSLGSASRRASTERRKTKKTFFLCGLTFPQGRLHREKKD